MRKGAGDEIRAGRRVGEVGVLFNQTDVGLARIGGPRARLRRLFKLDKAFRCGRVRLSGSEKKYHIALQNTSLCKTQGTIPYHTPEGNIYWLAAPCGSLFKSI